MIRPARAFPQRFFFLVTAVVLACAPAGSPRAAAAKGPSVADNYADVASSVVAIEVVSNERAEVETRGRVRAVRSIGSGVLISADGQVLTAAHVVQTADKLKVQFEGGENIDATVLRSDPAIDVALLQLAAVPKDAKPAKVADSDKVRTGDQVFVVGAPYGLARTLTVGNISARHREESSPLGLSVGELFQTDAAINQGNSGGPMFNMRGEVVGVVSHMLSMTGGYEGLGFAVTSNATMESLSSQGSLWSGVSWMGLNGPMAEAFNLPQPAGILVQSVAAGSIGDRLGLRGGSIAAKVEGVDLMIGGDIILEVQGVLVTPDAGLRKRYREKVAALKKGDKVLLKVLRGGTVIELQTTWEG